MPLTPQDIQNKRFKTAGRMKLGYDEDEVDAFLDEIEEELRRLIAENTSLRQAAAAAQAAPHSAMAVPPPPAPAAAPPPPAAPAPAPEETGDAALKTLMLAQKTAEDAIAQANAEAESILHSARLKATALEHEAQAAHANRLASLEDDRKELEAEIAALRGFEREFRNRLRSYLESSLADLDARPTVEPKAPPQPSAGQSTAGQPAAGQPGAASGPAAATPPAFGAGPAPVAPAPAPAAPPAAPPRPAEAPGAPPASPPPAVAPPAAPQPPQPQAAPQPPQAQAAPQPPPAAPPPGGSDADGRSALAAAAAAAASLSAADEPNEGEDAPTTELPRAGQPVPGVAPAAQPGGAPPGFVSRPVADDTPSGPPAQA
jgi:DivIVA domain-containing protein